MKSRLSLLLQLFGCITGLPGSQHRCSGKGHEPLHPISFPIVYIRVLHIDIPFNIYINDALMLPTEIRLIKLYNHRNGRSFSQPKHLVFYLFYVRNPMRSKTQVIGTPSETLFHISTMTFWAFSLVSIFDG